MPKKGIRDLEKELRWREILKRFAVSGKSRKDFCAAEGLKLDNFTYWKTTITARDNEAKLKKRNEKRELNQTFVALKVAEESQMPIEEKPMPVAQIHFAGGSIHVFHTSDTAFLKKLFLALKEITL